VSFPIRFVRDQFPALTVTDAGRPRRYFDGPGGTQICRPAMARMVAHMEQGTANAGGAFATSRETDALSAEAHAAMADLLGGAPGEIAFGPNMTSLTIAVSRAIAREWEAGDEVVLTRLDHDANVAPWMLAARDRGAVVRWLDFDPATGRLRIDQLPELLNERTRLVAVGMASNALGTLNDVPTIAAEVRERCDALIFVDAVQSVPHVPTDVAALGCDLLACSPYKFFGPHQGVLWGRAKVLERLEAYKVRPASDQPPARRFETGTPSFEGQAGVIGTIEYLASLGERLAPETAGNRRAALLAALAGSLGYEETLGAHLLDGLREVPGLTLYGPPTMEGRVPTFAFTLAGQRPGDVATALAEQGIFVWSGHFYAVETIARLGLAESGGLIRVGLCHYNSEEEIDALVEALHALARGR